MPNFRKIEMIVSVVMIFELSMLLFTPATTGGVTGIAESLHHDDVNLAIDSLQKYTLRYNSTSPLLSLGISGSVIGNGQANVWLEAGDERLLVWSNAIIQTTTANMITGMFSSAGTSSAFSDVCIETCVLPEQFQQRKEYLLIFEVKPGILLNIDEIVYISGFDNN